MTYGRQGRAPCGHLGEAVIGHYYACPRCDRAAAPEHVEPEETETICRFCGHDDVEVYERLALGDGDVYHCNKCLRSFTG